MDCLPNEQAGAPPKGCHGIDSGGRSLPFFVSKRKQVFATAIDITLLRQTQFHGAGLARSVIERWLPWGRNSQADRSRREHLAASSRGGRAVEALK